MNIVELKRHITIPDFMSKIGAIPTDSKGKFLHYKSPLREDNNPSFWVNTETGTCGDFAVGNIGDVINLAAAYWHTDNCTAKQNLEDMFRLGYFFSAKPKSYPTNEHQPQTAQNKITIKHLQPLQNRALVQYVVQERCISYITAKLYLQEAYYKINDGTKQFFAAAFKNDSGGYALRNSIFKNCCAPNDITTLPYGSDTVLIFEGFMDFLACVDYWKHKTNKVIPYDVIVLNSIANANKMNLDKYTTIKLMLDNDTAGQSTTATITTKYKSKHIEDITQKMFVGEYQGCKDFNDFWKTYIQNNQK